ncbi:MAG TPA: alpha/beta hydrolase-fold protein [Allosphingosinicella sp.]
MRGLMIRAAIAALLTLSAAGAAQAQAQARTSEPVPIVIGQTYRLASRALGEDRTINVWLPPSYAEGNRRYPILYLLDGGLAQDFHHITGLAQLGALSWQTQEFIVVGIETVDRRRELAFPIERDQALRARYPTAGGSDRFRRYLIDEVKPFVAGLHRTSGEDVLLGESLAGLFIVELFLREPAAFDTYIAMDPSLWWDNGRLSEEAGALLARHGAERRRLWISAGSETLAEPAALDRLRAALRTRPASALDFRDEPRPARTHATIYHPTAYEALQALYPRPEE